MKTRQPQSLLDALDKFPKDGMWHQTVEDENLTTDHRTYVMWDSEKADWRFITQFTDGRIQADYVGINETFEAE